MSFKRISAIILSPFWGMIALNVGTIIFYISFLVILYIPAFFYEYFGFGEVYHQTFRSTGQMSGQIMLYALYTSSSWSIWTGMILGTIYGIYIFFVAVVEAVTSDDPYNKLTGIAHEWIKIFKDK